MKKQVLKKSIALLIGAILILSCTLVGCMEGERPTSIAATVDFRFPEDFDEWKMSLHAIKLSMPYDKAPETKVVLYKGEDFDRLADMYYKQAFTVIEEQYGIGALPTMCGINVDFIYNDKNYHTVKMILWTPDKDFEIDYVKDETFYATVHPYGYGEGQFYKLYDASPFSYEEALALIEEANS